MAKSPKAEPTTFIQIKPPNLQVRIFRIYGTSPLICHKWSEKAKKEMLDKQMKRAVGPKGAKDPEQDYKDSLYTFPDGGYGFPAVAFKAAAVRAGTMCDIPMTESRQMFRVLGDPANADLVRIKGKPSMREDMVRLNGLTADIRYRGEFKEWEADVKVQYNADLISEEQLANLFESAGFSVGVGEWRMEKKGNFGSFTLRKGAK
jgi:hypothetical protein